MANLIKTALAVVSVLTSEGKIPTNVANDIAKTFSVSELRKISSDNLLNDLMKIPGVGKKRAAKTVQVLLGRIPHCMDNSRSVKTMKTRAKSSGFSLYSFNWEIILKEYLPLIKELEEYTYDPKTASEPEEQEKLMNARQKFDELVKLAWKMRTIPFDVKKAEAKINRMTYSMMALIFAIDTETRSPQKQVITVEFGVQQHVQFNWRVAGLTQKEAETRIELLQKCILKRLGKAGLVMHTKTWDEEQKKYVPEEIKYIGFAASASHQKKEKLVMAREDLMKIHEVAIHFGLTKEEFLKLHINGAAIWKLRANLLRPLRQKLMTEDGREVFLHDIGIWKDIKVMRHYENARRVGNLDKESESVHIDGPTDEERTIDDGAIHSEVHMNFEGQLTGLLLKGMGHDGVSANETAAELLGVPVIHGDKLLYMGEGCWKGDKLGLSWEEYVSRADKLAARYPGINNVWLLREADEPEDVTRVRRLTRSLIQQWITMKDKDIMEITEKARKGLKKLKTYEGAVKTLAKPYIPMDDETKAPIEKLFHSAPWLVLNPNIQLYLKGMYEKRKQEAAANKFVTEGTYPYIIEDPVAVYQIQRYECDPNSEGLGVLKKGEMSVPGILNEHKMLAIRFPANYQTARIMRNKPCKKAFASIGNIAVTSIYDDILVVQDGDTDGDEMAIIVNKIAIKYTEQMLKKYNPPTVIFEHGTKTKFDELGTEDNMLETMYDDLWKAKKFDGVGKYANLSTLCAHLASIAEQDGNIKKRDAHLVQMSLASTGATLAIDQVKGNTVSEELIDRLDEIGKVVRAECNHMMPYTQQFVKGIPANECNKATNALCDVIASTIVNDVGDYEMNAGERCWNKEEAKRVLTTFSNLRVTSVRKASVTDTIINELADNWFQDRNNSDDQKTFAAIKRGDKVGLKELATLLWRNACALEFRMEGENLTVKRAEYYKTVRDILYGFAKIGEWKSDGHVFNIKERKASVVNTLVSNALDATANGIDPEKRGSYAMFILKVFATELLWAVENNKADISLFNSDIVSADDVVVNDMVEEIDDALYGDEDVEIDSGDMWIATDDLGVYGLDEVADYDC